MRVIESEQKFVKGQKINYLYHLRNTEVLVEAVIDKVELHIINLIYYNYVISFEYNGEKISHSIGEEILLRYN